MVLLDKETMEELAGFEQAFRYAINSNFISMKSSDFQRFANIYARIFGALSPQRMSCNTCRLAALKKLGQVYMDTKKADEEAKERAEMSEENIAETPKKKAGRPKKIDLNN